MDETRLVRVGSRKTYVPCALRVLNTANFAAGSGKSILWYVVPPALNWYCLKVTYTVSHLSNHRNLEVIHVKGCANILLF
jgi:hypothetical protein